ncbi:hypothetical protein [Weissella bombi]|uniref:IrrE N-terminal-like domain-containing protein n=1 Tax=Weissella bombi TaxID=1505725 RepID=A0A1C4C6V2_9LACO|nr:hypothetical protein [Weissella bombi]SCC14846.1 hypothetical protein GA0061074_1255 [Weissella bombi]
MYEIEEQVDQLIYSSHVILQYAKFSPDDPDVVIIRIDKPPVIIINTEFVTPYPRVARKAHELSHIIYGNGVPMLYYFSMGFKNQSEIIANKGMIYILAKLVYGDTPLEYRNYTDFMNEFCLPSWFEPVVKDIIREV